MDFTILPTQLHKVAEAAELILRARLNLNPSSLKIEESFDREISWIPTFHWKLSTGGLIACEVSSDPLPIIITQNFSDLIASGLPIKLISAYSLTDEMSSKKYQTILTKAKQLGIGLLPINIDEDYSGKIEYAGISLTLMLPKINLTRYKDIFHNHINHCYELYMNGDPKHGVQELGQIIESILNSIAVKVNQKDTSKLSAFAAKVNAGKHYPLNTLIEDMIRDNILSKVFLKKCATFADMRNDTSHRPRNLSDTKRVEQNLKTSFEIGLQILEELPQETKNAGFTKAILI
jgi:hypothetical protein